MLNFNKDNFCYLIIPILMFFFVFTGHFILPGTDSLYHLFPNFLHSKNEFDLFGKITLWNKFIFSGFDMTSSMHSHSLNPINWPLLLLPKKYILHGFTFYIFLFCIILGFLWKKIGELYGLNKLETLLFTIWIQASAFFWFLMTSSATMGVQMFVGFSLLTLVIINFYNRSLIANFFFFLLYITLLFIYPHFGYIAPFLGFLFIILIYQNYLIEKKIFNQLNLIIFISFIFSMFLCLYRIYPVVEEIMNANVLKPYFPNRACDYAFLTMFDPVALGRTLGISVQYANKANLCPNFHIQIHNVLPMGVLSCFIIYLSLRNNFSKLQKILLTSFILLICVSVVSFKPLHDLGQHILSPFGTTSATRIFYFLIFMLIFIKSLKNFRSFFKKKYIDQNLSYLFEFLCIVLLFILFNLIYLDRTGFTTELLKLIGIPNTYSLHVMKLISLSFIFFITLILFKKDKIKLHLKTISFIFVLINFILILTYLFFISDLSYPDRDILKFIVILTLILSFTMIYNLKIQSLSFINVFLLLFILLIYLFPMDIFGNSTNIVFHNNRIFLSKIKLGIAMTHLGSTMINLTTLIIIANLLILAKNTEFENQIKKIFLILFGVLCIFIFNISSSMFSTDGKPYYKDLSDIYHQSDLLDNEINLKKAVDVNIFDNKNYKTSNWLLSENKNIKNCSLNKNKNNIFSFCSNGNMNNSIYKKIVLKNNINFIYFHTLIKAPKGKKFGLF